MLTLFVAKSQPMISGKKDGLITLGRKEYNRVLRFDFDIQMSEIKNDDKKTTCHF
jgi:hypothetical protein